MGRQREDFALKHTLYSKRVTECWGGEGAGGVQAGPEIEAQTGRHSAEETSRSEFMCGGQDPSVMKFER